MDYRPDFDLIVVGGGHAGTEAALAGARMGARTLLVTHALESLGQMSCNPSIGGIGKGHLVREVDALGGAMAIATDEAGIQFRTLNASKGPAVRATRAQADRVLYRQAIRRRLENQPGLWLFAQAVDDILVEGERLVGVKTQTGVVFRAPAVVLTAGTFLNGRVHVGLDNYAAGRAGDPPAIALSDRLKELQLPQGRLKTGTPPRLDGRSIDWAVLESQPGDQPEPVFSFWGSRDMHPRQIACGLTYTNPQTHAYIRAGLDRSPMFTGVIEGVGPRYCPSIEDKVHRFADRDSHQIYLEPEGLTTHEVYPNGISTSLPFDVQVQIVRSMRGLENAHILRPGYAIEYDFFDPRSLRASLQSRDIPGLFFAGQVNGTTGYEEAAAQGILAGINAVRWLRGESAWVPGRHEAYLGVMVDDLVTRGVTEPYRMFTSRAEYRLSLREDNADLRLVEQGRAMGLISDGQWAVFEAKQAALEKTLALLRATVVNPRLFPHALGGAGNAQAVYDLLRRPEARIEDLVALVPGLAEQPVEARSQAEVQIKYEGYIARQEQEVERHQQQEQTPIPQDLDYAQVSGLSVEVRQKLIAHRPETLGQASRISGVTPAAVSLLWIHLKRHRANPGASPEACAA